MSYNEKEYADWKSGDGQFDNSMEDLLYNKKNENPSGHL